MTPRACRSGGFSVAVVAGGSIATIHGEGGSASSFNTYFAAGHKSAEGSNVTARPTARSTPPATT